MTPPIPGPAPAFGSRREALPRPTSEPGPLGHSLKPPCQPARARGDERARNANRSPVLNAGDGLGRLWRVEGLCVRRPAGRSAGLRRISRVPEGRFVTLIGPSGCGKSTLVRDLGRPSPARQGLRFRPRRGRRQCPSCEANRLASQALALLPWRRYLEQRATAPRTQPVGWPWPPWPR